MFKNRLSRLLTMITSVMFLGAASAQAQIEIQFWHAMGGELGQKLTELSERFNTTQKEFKIVPVYKGNYTETMTAAIAAFRAKQQPHIVQVFEVGTATMMSAKGAVYPVYQLMADQKEPFNPKSYLGAVVGYYSDSKGNILSLPFNSSTPVMYYNKEAFRKAGLNPDQPPATWPELEAAAKKLQAAGYVCGFTTAWPSWVQLENLSAIHDQPIATKANGFDGLDTVLQLNGDLQVRHIGKLAEWQKTKIFDYGGRQSNSAPKFYSGECVMYMNSSAAYAAVRANAKFEFGVGMLPYWPDVTQNPKNSIIGGATLWVLNGHPKEHYRGVAKFFSYLSSPEIQTEWHQFSGYVPITNKAYEISLEQGFYGKNPGTDVSIKQLTRGTPSQNSKGLRLGSFAQIRDIIENEIEAILSGTKTAKQGLDDAVRQSNELLRQFERTNR